MAMTCEHLWVKNGNVVKSGTLSTKVAIKLLLVGSSGSNIPFFS